MVGEGGAVLVRRLWRRQSTKAIATVMAVTVMTTRLTKRGRAMKTMTEPSPREEGDDGSPPAARVHKNQKLR